MTAPDTITRSDVELHTGQNGDEVAHYYRANRIADAAVFGEPIPALCGYIGIPHRDHRGRAVCQRCKAIYDDQAELNKRGPRI